MRRIAAVVLFLLFFASFALAQDMKEVERYLDEIEGIPVTNADGEEGAAGSAIKYNFEIAPEYTSFHYEEPPINVKEDASLYGFNAVVTGRSRANSLMGRIEGRFVAGRVDYDGSLNDGTPWTDKGDDYAFESRALIGRDFRSNKSRITPFFGIGFRYWNDNLESQYAYERETRYIYSPIGIETASLIANSWIFGFSAEYDVFWAGVVKSHLSDVNVNFNNLKNEQDSGYGARCSVYLKKRFKEKFLLAIEPFFRYWDIDQSNNANVTFAGTIVGYGYEPANRTREYGLRVLLIW